MNYHCGMGDIGKRVRQRRLQLALSQTEVAELVCKINPSLTTAQSSINAVEHGKSKRPGFLPELAQVLGVTEQWLRAGDPLESPVPAEPLSIDKKYLSRLYEVLIGSYLMLGLDQAEAAALLRLVRKCAGEPSAQQTKPVQERHDTVAELTGLFQKAMRAEEPSASE